MEKVTVSVNIVTFNSAGDIESCLKSLETQTFRNFRIRIFDNASTDGTAARAQGFDVEITRSDKNLGFAAAHNRLIRNSASDYVLVLNPDALLREDFLEHIVHDLAARPDAGSASGKLLRMDNITIDSTGIVMLRNQRHLDRGADQPDIGQFDKAGDIFGPSGAAALYRRTALEDTAIDGEYFDEDFFAYREDADLAWRMQLLGWSSIYIPKAVAQHRRRVTPERRSQLPEVINYHSVKNRFLLRINNMTGDLYRRDFWRITGRDTIVVGYVLLREWTSAPAFGFLMRNLPRLWRKRKVIQAKVRVQPGELCRWFG
jgi:GT2 family glycosyltransferase